MEEETYSKLKAIASNLFHQCRPGETLRPTALVHETLLKLHGSHAFEMSQIPLIGKVMRQVVVDYIRTKKAQKRGAGAIHVPLDTSKVFGEQNADLFLRIHEALDELALEKPRLCQLIELKFFAGLNHEELGRFFKRSVPSIERDWKLAKTLLFRILNSSSEQGQSS